MHWYFMLLNVKPFTVKTRINFSKYTINFRNNQFLGKKKFNSQSFYRIPIKCIKW